jgi:hypothetical protein
MMDSKIKGLAFCSLVALFATGQAFAHTGVRDTATANIASYNGFTITHGCADYNNPGQAYPVIGQAAVFPFGESAVWREATITPKGQQDVVGAKIDGKTIVDPLAVYSLGVNGYASVGSAFATTRELVDKLGNVRGLIWKDGAMEPNLNTVTPFKITHPVIKNACISSVKVRVGVINYCDVGKNQANDAQGPYKAAKDAFGRLIPIIKAPGNLQSNVVANIPVFKSTSGGNGDHNRADFWFRDLDGGSKLYNDQAILGEPGIWSAGIIVNNPDVATGAVASACPGGKPRQVTVEPSGLDFDEILTGENTRPFTSGNGPF